MLTQDEKAKLKARFEKIAHDLDALLIPLGALNRGTPEEQAQRGKIMMSMVSSLTNDVVGLHEMVDKDIA